MANSTVVEWDGRTYGNTGEIIGRQLGPNECERGLVFFATPRGRRPQYVVFSSSSVIKWRVPK